MLGEITRMCRAPASSSPRALRGATLPPPMITIRRFSTSSIIGYVQGTKSILSLRAALKQPHARRVVEANLAEVAGGGEPLDHFARVHRRVPMKIELDVIL